MRKKKILSIAMSSILALGISSSVLATNSDQSDGVFFDRTTNGVRMTGRKMTAEEIERYKEFEKKQMKQIEIRKKQRMYQIKNLKYRKN